MKRMIICAEKVPTGIKYTNKEYSESDLASIFEQLTSKNQGEVRDIVSDRIDKYLDMHVDVEDYDYIRIVDQGRTVIATLKVYFSDDDGLGETTLNVGIKTPERR